LEGRDAFLSTITERLMAYATGGKAAINDRVPAPLMPAARAALAEAAAETLSWSSLIAAIVTVPSDPR
jgi:hypothetical protein